MHKNSPFARFQHHITEGKRRREAQRQAEQQLLHEASLDYLYYQLAKQRQNERRWARIIGTILMVALTIAVFVSLHLNW